VSSSGLLSTGKTQTIVAGPEEGHKNDQRAGTPLLNRKAERIAEGLFSLQKRRLRKELTEAFQ